MAKSKTKVMSTKTSISNKTVLKEIQELCEEAADRIRVSKKDEALVIAATAFVSINSLCQGALSVIRDIEEESHV